MTKLALLIVSPAVIGMLATPLLLRASQAAESPPPTLEQMLTDLQQQWKENDENNVPNPTNLHIRAERLRLFLCQGGKTEYCPTQKLEAKNIDIQKLAHAVAMAETSDKGMVLAKNNYHGIKCGEHFCSYASKEESYEKFGELWLRKYGDHLPTLQDARRYTAGEGTGWLKTVTVVYNSK